MTAPESPFEINSRIATIAVVSLTMLGAALRFYHLDAQCLWMDEIATLELVRSVRHHGLLRVAQDDHIAPLYIWMTQVAVAIGGETAFWLRFPSALAGAAAIPLMYGLGRRIFRSRALGVIATAIMAFSPFAIWYAQEARMYSLLLLLSIVFVGLSWSLFKGDSRPGMRIALAVTGMLGLYTHHYMALLIVAVGSFLLTELGWRDSRFRTWLMSQVIAVIAFVPWLVLTMRQLDAGAGTANPMILFWTPYTFFTFVGGFSLGPSIRELRSGAMGAIVNHRVEIAGTALTVIVLGAIGLHALLRQGRVAGTLVERRAVRLCLIWLVVPVVLATVATFVTNINYNVRYVIGVYPAFILILAAGIRETPRSMLAGIASTGLVVAVAIALWQSYDTAEYAKADVRPLASLLKEDDRPFDLLILDNDRICPLLHFYGGRCPDDALRLDPGQTHRISKVIDSIADFRSARRIIWLVEYRSWESDPEHRLRDYLQTISREVSVQSWPGVTLRVYHVE